MKKSYIAPAVIDYGTIAQNTFATPAANNRFGTPIGSGTDLGNGSYSCMADAGSYNGLGGKNYIVLQCDKFGEYSHS